MRTSATDNRDSLPQNAAALVADDHGLYRTGLSLLIKDNLAISNVFEAGTFDAALDLLASHPDIVLALFDLAMPGVGGPESLKVVRECYPGVRVAVVSASEARDHVVNTLTTGLNGYIPKSLPDAEIASALVQVLKGDVYVPRFMAVALPGAGEGVPAGPVPVARGATEPAERSVLEVLTPRQRDVLGLVVKGLSNKEIARSLDIAEGTVKIHLAALFAHFAVRNRTQLATNAARFIGA